MSQTRTRGARLLDALERAGNRLPHPVTLFILATALVLVLSHVGQALGWSASAEGLTAAGEDEPAAAAVRSLLDRDGLYHALSSVVDNFIEFPPLGVVLVGMLGVGVAERTGLIGAALRVGARGMPGILLTPAMVLLGILSSVGMDAGYVVLPPLAAALYRALGRSPLAGLAAAFAGISAGFSANLSLTALDPVLAGLTESAARILDPDYRVSPAANWAFMAVSTVVITLVGWLVTARYVEPRLRARAPDAGGPPGEAATGPEGAETMALAADERRGLIRAGWTLAAVLAAIAALVLIPGAPLESWHSGAGEEAGFARWVEAIVPLIFLAFLLPGLAYGTTRGTIRSGDDLARVLSDTLAQLAPILVLFFFAAQFIGYFEYTRLGEVLALAGGDLLARLELGPSLLMSAVVLLTAAFNLVIGSMSAKYALIAPILVPVLMGVGISPELTQAAYRIGDSVSNVITPLNPYFVLLLGVMQHYAPRLGIGTLIATMLPYSLAFLAAWLVLLLAWIGLGLPLGPDGGLEYAAGSGRG